ncbi:MAG: DoxX family protein, partial [Silvanigrellaceae bacterium]|nr:DoxX family protein [Silvanigrellaceae bacterium]
SSPKSSIHHILHNEDLGKFILRFAIGFLMMFHGVGKVMNGNSYVAATLIQSGLPEFLSYLVYVGEVVAPALLILGIMTRTSAFIIFVNMIFTIVLGYKGMIFTLNAYGGWIVELNMLYLLSALAVMFFGAGKYALMRSKCC